MRKRLLVVVLLGMLSFPLSALAGRAINGGYYCANVDYITCFPDDPGDEMRSAGRPSSKENTRANADMVASGAFVLASLILLLLRTRAL